MLYMAGAVSYIIGSCRTETPPTNTETFCIADPDLEIGFPDLASGLSPGIRIRDINKTESKVYVPGHVIGSLESVVGLHFQNLLRIQIHAFPPLEDQQRK
jgi:hypothetical protein